MKSFCSGLQIELRVKWSLHDTAFLEWLFSLYVLFNTRERSGCNKFRVFHRLQHQSAFDVNVVQLVLVQELYYVMLKPPDAFDNMHGLSVVLNL